MTTVVAPVPNYSAKVIRARRRKKLRRGLRYVGIAIVCVIALFPVYWMVVGSFQPEQDTLSYPPSLLFKGFTLGAFTSLFKAQPIANWLLHSFQVSMVTVVITAVLLSRGPTCSPGCAGGAAGRSASCSCSPS